MSTDYAEKEREFLETLEADTGRGLAAWMDAISAQKFAVRNEAIDWLRQQGFMFWKASWLERIHQNGGRPIYGDAGPAVPQKPAATAVPALASIAPVVEPPKAVDPAPMPPAPSPAAVPAAFDTDLEDLLKKAKALAPLARFVLREIAKSVPGSTFAASGNTVSIRRDAEFAVIAIGPKELKLGLALPGDPVAAPLQAAKFAAPTYRVAETITHMALLSDARQIDASLMAHVARAGKSGD